MMLMVKNGTQHNRNTPETDKNKYQMTSCNKLPETKLHLSLNNTFDIDVIHKLSPVSKRSDNCNNAPFNFYKRLNA